MKVQNRLQGLEEVRFFFFFFFKAKFISNIVSKIAKKRAILTGVGEREMKTRSFITRKIEI